MSMPKATDTEIAFERFFKDHYEFLPSWVNADAFKETLKAQYVEQLNEARSEGLKTYSAVNLLYPLMSDQIDPGTTANYDHFNKVQLNSVTGQII